MRRGLGQMPLTLFVIVAAVVLYLYIRRSRLGIDQHPGERQQPGQPAKAPSVYVGPPAFPVGPGIVPAPVLPAIPGTPNGPGGLIN